MSLYTLQKLLYQLNRDPAIRRRYEEQAEEVIGEYELSAEELEALRNRDVGLLYVIGVNGQLLMHYAAMCGMAWPDYIEAMKEGVRRHGPVRAGIYAMVKD
ncbi:MAG: aromatic ring-opening dioxygenase subunit LigA [Betaproteobacteria bacterium RIFCSPLOWO2_02_FULL_62_17]|nr:MAG: aromatic ring-opening dioxygenase subunit LigA [Betaproteobacteria bacterium RIFCSPLOWO2_02_FULL_62_17]